MKKDMLKIANSLAKIGLSKEANYLKDIYALYKLSFTDFSKEAHILKVLANILDNLHNLKSHEKIEDTLSLPSFVIETRQKRVSKDSESLQGYTKKEAMKGIQNYLSMFINYYMKTRITRIAQPEQQLYGQIIDKLEIFLDEFKKVSTVLEKGVSKQSIWSNLSKALRTAGMINLYLEIVRKASKEVQDDTWLFKLKLRDYERVLSPQEMKTLQEQESWSKRFEVIDFDLEDEMAKIEQEFMSRHGLSEQELYAMIKTFRSPDSLVNYKQKVNEYVSDKLTKQAAPNEEDDDENEDEDLFEEEELFADIDELESFLGKPIAPGSDINKVKELDDPSKIKSKKPPTFFTDLPEMLRQRDTGEETDYKHVVNRIISSNSLTISPKSEKLYRPGTVFYAYRKYLLPLFREQYTATLLSAYQIYMSLYRVQRSQGNISKILKDLAIRLEMISE